jgi:hypothetical protein
VWWLWVVGGLVAWLVLSVMVAVIIGRGIRLADRRSAGAWVPDPRTTGEAVAVARPPVAAPARRRAIPLPPLALALLSLAVALEVSGYVVRLTGTSGTAARLLSMDAPNSLPRMFVAAVFAAAAVMAVAAAARMPERRTWWGAVGVVAAGIAVVKAGSTVHTTAFGEVSAVTGTAGAMLVSVLAAGAVVGTLWFLSRTERRDRLRVLGALTLYAGAAVGLSAASTLAYDSFGSASSLTSAVVFLEEAGEAIGGVVFLVAVLAGVAPRLVLPAEWALRRTADAHTLDVPDALPGRSGAHGPARG